MKLARVGVWASSLAILVNGLSFTDIHEDGIQPDVATDEERIVGGSDGNPGNYPYLASLRSGGPHKDTFCGGVLIAPQYVLTAGHCFEYDLKDMHVSFGMRHAFGKGSSKSEKIRVSELFRHPKFDLRKLKYDVALIKLESPSTKKLAKLPAADGSSNKPGTMATAVGWGLVNNETFATTLKTVDVKILTDEECAKMSGNTATKTTLCAGIGDGKDACEGDSGGPLITNEAVVGLVSSGPQKCGTSAGYYTRVSSVLDYIHDILNGDSTGNVTEFLVMPYNFSYDPRPMPPAVGQ